MLLTPIPFNTQEAYNFLNIPALFHWLSMPFILNGIFYIYRVKTGFSRFFIIYLSLFMLLYGVYEELQGPRHRVQLDYAFALLQFFGFYLFFMMPKRKAGTAVRHNVL